MKRKIFPFLLGMIAFIGYAQNSEITINISGLKTDKGKCMVYLYNSKKGYSAGPNKAINTATGKITNGKSTLVLKDTTDGEYVITVVHDENNNSKLDTNFLGMPKEGVGVSNNAKGSFGPPSYEDSKFKINKKSVTTNITIKYL
jgi:uncharacterized protein (DUF2141 family)